MSSKLVSPLVRAEQRRRRFVIVGNPENRRVTLFQEALALRGEPAAHVVRWLDIARGEEPFRDVPNDAPALVRIDSFGEDFDVTRELLRRGADDARDAGVWALSADEIATLPYDRGRILAPKQEHLGFLRALGDVERALAARPELQSLSDPKSIVRLFDKRECSRVFAEAGVPVPRALETTNTMTARELRARMRAEKISRVFVKLTCGSSASCLGLFHSVPSKKEEWLFTSMEIDGDNLYNSLKPRRYQDRDAIDRLLGFLFREGSHVEEHVAKARYKGRFFDTRMLAIDGDVVFTVMRKSVHPITNLHLGGERGTPEELAEAIPEDVREAAHASCRRVAALQKTLQLGIDVMFTAKNEPNDDPNTSAGHRILEANAFGDLLPNLTRDGLSVYEWEIRAALKDSLTGDSRRQDGEAAARGG